MSVTKLEVKKMNDTGAAPLKNLNILDDIVVKARTRATHLPGIVTFSGPSGFGKSTAAAYVAAKHQAHYCEIRSTWTKKAFLEALLKNMGIPPLRATYQMMDQVSEELATSNKPLILDEFDHAVERNLIELIRDIYEQSQAPIILIGEERLPQKLVPWERFHGRIMGWAKAEPASLQDARALNKHYYPAVAVSDDLLSLVVEEGKGSIRRIVTNLDMIALFARSEGIASIGCKEWGRRALHSSNPPKTRSF